MQWEDIPDEFKKNKKLKFDLEMLNEFDQENQLRQEREKGLSQGCAEGLQQGLQQGEDNKARAIAIRMLSTGYDIQEVSVLTGLSSEEIAELNQ